MYDRPVSSTEQTQPMEPVVPAADQPWVGVVVIGRNEGERLVRCLRSVLSQTPHGSATENENPRAPIVVYVDSNSTDDSVRNATNLGAHVVDLDTSRKFTAARARNAGLARLLELAPGVEFVQFVDGDCELDAAWLAKGTDFLRHQPTFAVVCGRRRERFPDRSIYNHLCDIEWDTPPGRRPACGGDALIRASALRSVGGYRESLIAGEEPEMCFRLRKLGFAIMRLDEEMTLHDAAMFRFTQWFQRSRRAGHAYAEMAALHGSDPERPGVRQTARSLAWALGFPLLLLVVGLAWSAPWALALGILGLAYLYAKTFRAELANPKRTSADARLYAASCVLAKVPESFGVLTYLKNRLLGRQSTLLEYKSKAIRT